MITFMNHSSLDAIGFLAAITTRLVAAGISMNAVSADYHDHLFVSVDKVGVTMILLRELLDR